MFIKDDSADEELTNVRQVPVRKFIKSMSKRKKLKKTQVIHNINTIQKSEWGGW